MVPGTGDDLSCKFKVASYKLVNQLCIMIKYLIMSSNTNICFYCHSDPPFFTDMSAFHFGGEKSLILKKRFKISHPPQADSK
jgi:hypothetical protein